MRSFLAVLALALFVSGCSSHTRIPDGDRQRLERSLPGRTFYLRHAMYLGPFWSDADKRFLTDGVPGEIPWVLNPAGIPIEPGTPERVIPAGTRVRVRKLELPTGLAVTTRNPFGPQYNPWLFVEVEGLPRTPAPVLLLRREIHSHDEMMAEIDRWLSTEDLAPALGQLEPEILRAVNEKRLVEGMPAEAVSMAWGYPERKQLTTVGDQRREEWIWPFEKRKATIVGGRLVSWEGEGATLAQ